VCVVNACVLCVVMFGDFGCGVLCVFYLGVLRGVFL